MKTTKMLWVGGLIALLAACGDDGGSPVDPGADAGQADTGAGLADAGVDANIPDALGAAPIEVSYGEGCNPLGAPHHCVFPYPSNVFLTETDEGPRVRFEGEAVTLDLEDQPIDWFDEYPADGFGRHPLIGAYFGVGVDTSAAVQPYDAEPERSLLPDHLSVVLRADTGEPVTHWLEVDGLAESDDERVLIVRVADRLEDGARYIVGLQSLVDVDGQPIDATPAFAGMRDGATFLDADVQALADRYESDVFAPLEEFGVSRADLVLAWDFTVQSWESATTDMLSMREQTLASFDDGPVACTAEIVDEGEERVRIEGTIEVPLFIEDDQTGARFVRGDDGLPARNGSVEVPFLAVVDRGLLGQRRADAPDPVRARLLRLA